MNEVGSCAPRISDAVMIRQLEAETSSWIEEYARQLNDERQLSPEFVLGTNKPRTSADRSNLASILSDYGQ